MKVFEALERLKQDGPEERLYGICGNFDCDGAGIIAWDDHYRECFRNWNEFSGSDEYPVPSFDDRTTPANAFFNITDGMWSADHPYGAARLRLLDHCINWFKELDM